MWLPMANRKQNQNKLCVQCDNEIEYDCLERVLQRWSLWLIFGTSETNELKWDYNWNDKKNGNWSLIDWNITGDVFNWRTLL